MSKRSWFRRMALHGAQDYLIAEFMSPYSNKRHDAYGGSLMERLKFPLDIIRSIRREVGGDKAHYRLALSSSD